MYRLYLGTLSYKTKRSILGRSYLILSLYNGEKPRPKQMGHQCAGNKEKENIINHRTPSLQKYSSYALIRLLPHAQTNPQRIRLVSCSAQDDQSFSNALADPTCDAFNPPGSEFGDCRAEFSFSETEHCCEAAFPETVGCT